MKDFVGWRAENRLQAGSYLRIKGLGACPEDVYGGLQTLGHEREILALQRRNLISQPGSLRSVDQLHGQAVGGFSGLKTVDLFAIPFFCLR